MEKKNLQFIKDLNKLINKYKIQYIGSDKLNDEEISILFNDNEEILFSYNDAHGCSNHI